jgi:hypothetical protein
VATFSTAIAALDAMDTLAYLHVVEAPVGTSGPDDLAARIRRHAPLNDPDRSTFYSSGDHGYLDYPTAA